MQFVVENTDATTFDDSVRKWLAFVDIDLIDNESREILKFGMRTELSQEKRDAARKPSDLYIALSESTHYQNIHPTVLLARFVYALTKLGHRRYGRRAIEQLSRFSIEKPTEFCPAEYMRDDKLQEFLFHQCLVEIMVKLKEGSDNQLIRYFSKNHFHGANPRMISDRVMLFTELVHRGIITKNETTALVYGLQAIGDDESINCVVAYEENSHQGM